jgi:hypothetical protein
MKNAPIMIFNPAIELQGIIDDYESLQFTRSFYGIGEFELHIHREKTTPNILRKTI